MTDPKLKAQIRLYYETHEATPKETAENFNIEYRTLMHWIKNEGWERGGALKNVLHTNIKQNLLNTELGTLLHLNKEKIKQNLKDNLNSQTYQNLKEDETEDYLESLSEDLLFKLLNTQFLHTNMIKAALIAKEELMRIRALRKAHQPSPQLINSADKFVNILSTIQKNLYDEKIINKALNLDNVEDLSLLSNEDLKRIAYTQQEEEESTNG